MPILLHYQFLFDSNQIQHAFSMLFFTLQITQPLAPLIIMTLLPSFQGEYGAKYLQRMDSAC